MRTRIAPELVIFSDLDGTFLDHHSYAFTEALPAYRDCQSAGVPVVFCSSKTRAEMEPLLQELGVTGPFIPENGGAVFVPRNYFPFPVDFNIAFDGYQVIQLGTPYTALTSSLDTLSRNLGVPVRTFHQMTPCQIAAETGLPDWKAQLASAREYDEPFTFSNGTARDVDRFLKSVESAGLRWTKGGRFYHLLGHAGKHPAVSILTSLYRRWNPKVHFAGLGDSVNDTGMLAAVDVAILVQKPDGEYDPAVARALPGVQRSPSPGPRGWTVSVKHLLAETGRLAPQRRRSYFLARVKDANLPMNIALTENMHERCGLHGHNFPVDNLLLKQRKCRTQALKQLLSMPPASTETAPRRWRLAHMIADFLSHRQVKPL